MGINTGSLTSQLRQQSLSDSGWASANWLAEHYATATAGARLGLRLLDSLHGLTGNAATRRILGALRRVGGRKIPHWTPYFPRAARRLKLQAGCAASTRKVVYMPSCLTRTFAPATVQPDQRPLNEVVASVLGKAGYELLYPAGLDNLCCGTPFQSKGAVDAAAQKLAETTAALLQASEQGRWPVIVDNGVCTASLLQGLRAPRLKVYDVTTFVQTVAAEYLEFVPQDENVALHVVCSMRKLGEEATLNALAQRCAKQVTVPSGITCCGFA
ncbi:(Fe-S)-binding protein [Paludibacterium denitrificans]|uniref:(Fe-S)-binding protein n=1 Tax=Paludibacterium denitrificans TaxID=2675226 RepID=UPI001E36AA22|nr:(Fe-S)-binding protein [Paludibacterium denitrificans]